MSENGLVPRGGGILSYQAEIGQTKCNSAIMLLFQSDLDMGGRKPRALPWAKVCWPFRPEQHYFL
jgi:hypothetical protein